MYSKIHIKTLNYVYRSRVSTFVSEMQRIHVSKLIIMSRVIMDRWHFVNELTGHFHCQPVDCVVWHRVVSFVSLNSGSWCDFLSKLSLLPLHETRKAWLILRNLRIFPSKCVPLEIISFPNLLLVNKMKVILTFVNDTNNELLTLVYEFLSSYMTYLRIKGELIEINPMWCQAVGYRCHPPSS